MDASLSQWPVFIMVYVMSGGYSGRISCVVTFHPRIMGWNPGRVEGFSHYLDFPPPPGRVPYGRKRCLAQKHRYQASRKKGWFSWHSMGEPSWFTIRIWWGRNHPRVHVQVRSYELGLKPAGHLAQSWMRHPPSHGFLSVFSNTTTWWFHGCNEKLVLWSAQCLFTADCQVGQKSGHIVLGSVVRRVMGTNTK